VERFICARRLKENTPWLLTVVGVTFCTANSTVHGKTRDIAAPVFARPPTDLGFISVLALSAWHNGTVVALVYPFVSASQRVMHDDRTPVTSVAVY